MKHFNTILLSFLLSAPFHAVAQFTYDASFVRYKGLRYVCDGIFTPVVTIKNTGAAAMSSCVVDTWKNGLHVGSFDWQLPVEAEPDESRNPALPAVNDVQAGDVLEFHIISVNGNPDEDASGNILSLIVEDPPSTAESFLVQVVVPGPVAYTTTWRVINALGQPVVQGGPYASAEDQDQWVMLDPASCYALEVSGGGGCEAQLFSEGQEVVIAASWEGGIHSEGFITGIVQGIDAATTTPAFAVAPNPTNGPLRVTFDGDVRGADRFLLLDAMGRAVLETRIPEGTDGVGWLDLSGLPAGTYVMQAISSVGVLGSSRVVVMR